MQAALKVNVAPVYLFLLCAVVNLPDKIFYYESIEEEQNRHATQFISNKHTIFRKGVQDYTVHPIL
jgi:hypothetical protein